MNKNLLGLVASGALVIIAPIAGGATTAYFLGRSFDATARVDPSQKARLLSEGISGSMQGTLYGFVVAALAFGAAMFFAVRLYRDSRRVPQPTS